MHVCPPQVEMFCMWMCTWPLASCIGAISAALLPLRTVSAGSSLMDLDSEALSHLGLDAMGSGGSL